MPDREPFLENRRLPAILDIVKIDDRWAQILIPVAENTLIRYLDDGSTLNINLGDYKLDQLIDSGISNYELINKTEFPPEVLEKVYYDAVSQDPKLKKLVNIYGFYSSKA